jgi:hypothetical protein
MDVERCAGDGVADARQAMVGPFEESLRRKVQA